MTHKKEVWAESTQKNLKTVLTLLLGLANEPNSTWKKIEDAIDNDVSQRYKAVQSDELARIISKNFSDLKKSLKVAWHMTGKADQPNEDPLGTEINGKWLHLHKASSGMATIDAIRQCIDYLSRDNSSKRLASNEHIFHRQSQDQVRNGLSLMAQLPVYTQLLPGSPQGKMFRHFALDFSGCKTRELDDCWAVIEQQINEERDKRKDTKKRTGSSEKKLNPALTTSLNKLVEALLPKLKSNFEARRSHEQKHIHVPLKATIRPADWAKQEEPEAREPGPEDLMGLAGADDSQLLYIWEEGGAGKTSLAYEIASWGLEGRLADHPLLPYFLDFNGFELTSTASLSQHLFNGLDRLGGPDLSEDDVKKLLRHKRLLLIVDHFSELTKEQRVWVRDNLPARSLVLLTSRLADHKDDFVRNSWKVTEIKPQRLVNQELLDFFKEYVERDDGIREDVRKVLLDPEHSLRRGDLLQRIVGHKPVTVLLAWLVMRNAIKHIEDSQNSPDNGPADLLPNSIPQLMEVYVRELCGDKSRSLRLTSRPAQDCKWNPGIILPSLKALALEAHCQNEAYHPNNFGRELANGAFASVRIAGKPLDDDVQQGLLDALVGELTLVTCIDSNDTPDSTDTPDLKVYRISLDPLADYLAALKQQEIWQSSGDQAMHLRQVAAWLKGIKANRELGKNMDDSALEAVKHMRGFLAACRDCYTQWLRHPDRSKGAEPQQWQQVLNDFADLAGINQQKERIMEAEYLIRRHAYDLEYNNFELRPKAIAEISAYAQELKAMPQSGDSPDPPDPGQPLPVMKVALQPLAVTLADPTIPIAHCAAAADALGHIGGARAAEILIQRIDASEEPRVAVRRAAAEALGLVEAPGDDPEAHWRLLENILADKTNHLDGDSFEAMDAKLPLLQGAARGLQRLATRCRPFPLPNWGSGPGLKVPMLTLKTTAGHVSTRMVEDVEVWQLPLPGDVPLEMVRIPGGTYTIGSPREEQGRDLYGPMNQVKPEEVQRVEAQRQVTVPSFAMARFPLTQAQWRSLAGADHQQPADRELPLDPAKEKGQDWPVESVSWQDASAWCDRLQRHLHGVLGDQAPRVGLPSESLWEVACRAGTDTAFHFGDTIDASWANYRGTTPYPSGRSGLFVNHLFPVGLYGLVNPWGLADLHGTLWEWCADVWHPNPLAAPEDGSPRINLAEGLQAQRLLRGGSWFFVPQYCRSAYRNCGHPASHGDFVGFRVCCLPPGSPSWSFNP